MQSHRPPPEDQATLTRRSPAALRRDVDEAATAQVAAPGAEVSDKKLPPLEVLIAAIYIYSAYLLATVVIGITNPDFDETYSMLVGLSGLGLIARTWWIQRGPRAIYANCALLLAAVFIGLDLVDATSVWLMP